MTTQATDVDREFTEQDRKDVELVVTAFKEQLLDEFKDSGNIEGMYHEYAVMVGRVAVVMDQSSGEWVPVDEADWNEDDHRRYELNQACKRILGSGRFEPPAE